MPPEHEAGVHATVVSVWNTSFEFVVDFAVETSGEPAPLVVSRVRMPVGVAFMSSRR